MTAVLDSTHECATWRMPELFTILFVNEHCNMVIVHCEENRFCFPQLASPEIPWYGQKMSECLSLSFEKMCDTKYKLVFLYSNMNNICQDSGPYIAIFEVISPKDPIKGEPVCPISGGYAWMSFDGVRELFKHSNSRWIQSGGEQRAFQELRRMMTRRLQENKLGAWEMPGWHTETTSAASNVLRKLGYIPRNSFEQYSVTSGCAVLRTATEKGRVYLKGSDGTEGKLTALVAGFAPELVRKPLYVNEEKHWMLMNDYGETMEEDFDKEDYERLCVLLGKLHKESVKHIEELKDVGVPVESPESLLERTKMIVEKEEFTRTLKQCAGFETCELEDMRECYKPLYKVLQFLYSNERLPLCLVHGDLNKGNIIRTDDDEYVVFDWGCAKIDIPLLDVWCLRDQVCSEETWKQYGMKSYFSVWEEHEIPSDVDYFVFLLRIKVRLSMALEGFDCIKSNCTISMGKADVLELVNVLEDIVEMEEKQ
ncbi:unnamed protein product [Agarophyton chilense]